MLTKSPIILDPPPPPLPKVKRSGAGGRSLEKCSRLKDQVLHFWRSGISLAFEQVQWKSEHILQLSPLKKKMFTHSQKSLTAPAAAWKVVLCQSKPFIAHAQKMVQSQSKSFTAIQLSPLKRKCPVTDKNYSQLLLLRRKQFSHSQSHS